MFRCYEMLCDVMMDYDLLLPEVATLQGIKKGTCTVSSLISGAPHLTSR